MARERVDAVVTFTVVHARRRGAIVDVPLAHRPGVSRVTHAFVVVVQVQTLFRSLGTARVAQAFVDARLALQTQETGPAAADESVQHVDARPAVLARPGGAVVDQVLASFTGVTDVARARITVHQVRTLAVATARAARAIVNVYLARGTGPSRMAHALMAEQSVDAHAVLARVGRAYFDFRFATFPRESRRTGALEIVDQVGTRGTQETRPFRAIVDVHVAMFTLPTGFTFALVSALFQRRTRGRILARVQRFRTRIDLNDKTKYHPAMSK